MRALMIQHHFPPGGPMAAQRARRLTCQLPELGIDPLVVAAERSAAHNRSEPAVELIDEVPVVVMRVRGPDPIAWYHRRAASRAAGQGLTAFSPGSRWKRWVRACMIPDEEALWIGSWTQGGLRVARDGCELVYSTSRPYSAHLAALSLAKQLRCPWVMELRDQWSDNRYLPQVRNPLTRRVQQKLEARCFRHADRIVVLNEAHAAHLAARRPDLASRVRVVANMFEPQPREGMRGSIRGKGLRVLFAGLIYGGRTLASVGRAIDAVSGSLPGFECAVLEAAGKSYEGSWEEVLGGSGPGRRVHGLLAPPDVAGLMTAVHAGIVNNPSWDDIHIPGKLYEYLGAGLPVLNFSRQPDIPRLCAGIVPCWQLDPADHNGIVRALREVAQWWLEHPEGSPRPGPEHPLSSRSVARRLAAVFRELVP